MKPKFLRFCGSLGAVLLAGALPLWLLWRRADLAREHTRDLEARTVQATRDNVRERKSSAVQRLAQLESAPAQLSAGSFVEWEKFCQDQPWTALRPVLDKRLAQIAGNDDLRTLLLIRWAAEDGAAAAAWTREHFPDNQYGRLGSEQDAHSVGATWAWHDPAGFSASQRSPDRWNAMPKGSGWLARRDVTLAFETGRMPYDESTDWTRSVAEFIAPFLRTPAEAKVLMELVRKEKHDESYPPVNYITVIVQAWADMDEAGALAAANAYPGKSTDSLKMQALHYVMRNRPQSEANADEWMQRMPEDRRRKGLKEIIKGLMTVDMATTGRWLLRQDPAIAGEALREFMWQFSYCDPAAALAMAPSVPTDAPGADFVPQLVAHWAADSPETATEMLKSQGWSEARISGLKDRMAASGSASSAWWHDW